MCSSVAFGAGGLLADGQQQQGKQQGFHQQRAHHDENQKPETFDGTTSKAPRAGHGQAGKEHLKKVQVHILARGEDVDQGGKPTE